MKHRIEITIKKPANQKAKRRPAPRPLIRTGDSPDVLSRRKGRFVNFYDLGQITNGMGGFIDIPFRVIPATTSPDPHHLAFTSANWDAFWTYIFTVNIADWETNYKKLSYTEAERYGLDLFGQISGLRYQVSRNGANLGNDSSNPVSDTKWTPQGLRLPPSISNVLFESGGNGAFALWSTDTTFFKITTGNTFGSAEVPFAFNGTANVFLPPRISAVSMTSDNGVNSDAVIYPYKALQRSFWLNRNYDVNPYPLFSVGAGLDLSAADKTALKGHIAADADSVYWDSIGGYGGSPSTFPAYPNNRQIDINTSGNAITPDVPYATGKLVAVIKQQGTIYYIWSKFGGVTYSNSRTVSL